jgi:hypothetical protein
MANDERRPSEEQIRAEAIRLLWLFDMTYDEALEHLEALLKENPWGK